MPSKSWVNPPQFPKLGRDLPLCGQSVNPVLGRRGLLPASLNHFLRSSTVEAAGRTKLAISFFSTVLGLCSFLLFPQTLTAETPPPAEREIIIRDTGLYFKVFTTKKIVSEILFDLDLNLNHEDRIFPGLDQEAFDRVIIERATEITVYADNQSQKVNTFSRSVNESLQEAQITLGPADELNCKLADPLFSGMEIVVTRVAFDSLTTNVPIPFKKTIRKDSELAWGKTKVIQEGKNGILKQTYKRVLKDGKEAERILEGQEVIAEPQDQVIAEGIKIMVGEASEGIASFYRYGDQLTCASTRFPKGTKLRVTNKNNQKQVIVTVNDFGPFVPGRIIDLNISAFEKIAPLGAGVARVVVEKILD